MPETLSLEQVPCNLCGSSRFRTIYNRPYVLNHSLECGTFVATTDEFHDYGQVVRCRDCGLVFTNPRPSRDQLMSGYFSCEDKSYLKESSSRSVNAHFSLNTIKRFIVSGKLLEVGASAGYFLNAARIDFDVVGLEPSRWACEEARRRFKVDIYPETFEESKRIRVDEFDVVVMIDVIEHVADPRLAVQRAFETLKPGGILYLVTPDIASLSARILRGYWWGLRPAHIYYFDRSSMKRLLQQSGFEVIHAHSFGRIFSYGYWASRLQNYPSILYRTLLGLIRKLNIEDKFLYLNTRDSMEICARKPLKKTLVGEAVRKNVTPAQVLRQAQDGS